MSLINLSVALAENGARVVLLDADLVWQNVDVLLGSKRPNTIEAVLGWRVFAAGYFHLTGPAGHKDIRRRRATRRLK